MFDSPARSGNHFAIAMLAESFPDVKFYWGYPQQHSPESFSLPKEKADYIISILRHPLDCIISTIIVWNNRSNTGILSTINSYEIILKSMLDNKDKINFLLFEDLVSNPKQFLLDVKNILNVNMINIDCDDIKLKLTNYYKDFLYVVPINNDEEKQKVKNLLLSEYKNQIDYCINIYNELRNTALSN